MRLCCWLFGHWHAPAGQYAALDGTLHTLYACVRCGAPEDTAGGPHVILDARDWVKRP